MRSFALCALAAGGAVAAPFAALDKRAPAGLNAAAIAAGKLYFGTAVDNGDLNDQTYKSILANTNDFGQITPANSMKWCVSRMSYVDETRVDDRTGTPSSPTVVNSLSAKVT
jgi:GH35 family endo-1,4-beta-xylanase